MKRILLSISIIFLFISCSNKLSNSNAKNIIEKGIKDKTYDLICSFETNKHWTSDYRSSGGFCSVVITNPPSNYEQEVLNYFISENILVLNQQIEYKNCAQWTNNTLEVTQKGKEFLISETNSTIEIKTFVFDIDEIKRIDQSDDSNYATVYFSITEKENESLVNIPVRKCFNPSAEINARFVKNDNNWELQK